MLYSVKRILIKRSGLHERNLSNAIQKHRFHGQKKGLMTKFKLHESYTVNIFIYMHFRHNQTTTTTTTRGDNHKIAKITKTTEPISTKFGTKHPWVKEIQVCSNEGPRPFPGGDKKEIVKIY